MAYRRSSAVCPACKPGNTASNILQHSIKGFGNSEIPRTTSICAGRRTASGLRASARTVAIPGEAERLFRREADFRLQIAHSSDKIIMHVAHLDPQHLMALVNRRYLRLELGS